MISWSISAAVASNCFDKIYVSTDDSEIADISKKEGAEIPFIRPSHLSDDFTTTQEVIIHGINWLKNRGFQIDIVSCIYATAPFVDPDDIKEGINFLKNNKHNSFVFSATTFDFPIQRAIKVNKNGLSQMLKPENYFKRSQDLEEYYHDAGQFYLARKNIWENNSNFFEYGKPIILPRWRVQDIDNEEDWIRAENLHQIIYK